MKLWNKTLDGFWLRDFKLLFESRQHNREMSEIIFSLCWEKGGEKRPNQWIVLVDFFV